MSNPLKLTNRDFYGNEQQSTPTIALLSKRNQKKVESPDHKGWTLTREHMTAQQAESWIDTAVKTHFNGESASKKYTLIITLEEEST